jgi:hypothetical protein
MSELQGILESKFGPTLHPTKIHTVTKEQFLKKPWILGYYDWKNPITRANYMDWLMTTFKLSLGNPNAQLAACEWSRLNLGFNYFDAFHAFDEVRRIKGNWSFLRRAEQSYFCNEFRRVAKHKSLGDVYTKLRRVPNYEILNDISSQTSAQVDIVEVSGELKRKDITTIKRITRLPKSQFLREITSYARSS